MDFNKTWLFIVMFCILSLSFTSDPIYLTRGLNAPLHNLTCFKKGKKKTSMCQRPFKEMGKKMLEVIFRHFDLSVLS